VHVRVERLARDIQADLWPRHGAVLDDRPGEGLRVGERLEGGLADVRREIGDPARAVAELEGELEAAASRALRGSGRSPFGAFA
jgi:hypothetical protein